MFSLHRLSNLQMIPLTPEAVLAFVFHLLFFLRSGEINDLYQEEAFMIRSQLFKAAYVSSIKLDVVDTSNSRNQTIISQHDQRLDFSCVKM